MTDVRYLYTLHVRDLRCGHCGETVVAASPARPELRIAVGAVDHRPVRLPSLDDLPAPVLMSVRCRCGRDVFYGAPADAVPLLTSHAPQPLTPFSTYVLAGA